jgi:hypothetical protein
MLMPCLRWEGIKVSFHILRWCWEAILTQTCTLRRLLTMGREFKYHQNLISKADIMPIIACNWMQAHQVCQVSYRNRTTTSTEGINTSSPGSNNNNMPKTSSHYLYLSPCLWTPKRENCPCSNNSLTRKIRFAPLMRNYCHRWFKIEALQPLLYTWHSNWDRS